MIASGRFIRSALLIFFSLAALMHFYFNRTTLNPHYGKAFYRLGLECENKCGLDEQLSYFRKAVFYDPNLNDAYDRLGIIYGRNGQHKEEIESYKKVVQLDHANGEAYFKVGLHYFQNGELDYALRYFLQSERRKHDSHDTYYYMGQLYEKKGMYDAAITRYRVLIAWGSAYTAKACERMWYISKIPGQYDMVLSQVELLQNSARRELREPIEQYIKTDRAPEFMRKSDGEGR